MSGPSLLVEGAIVVAATAAIWLGSDWLEGASDALSSYYGLPMVVQGAVVSAVGSSFPELATVVVSALSGSFDLGVGAIVGSAIFNILVIPSVVGVATVENVESNRTLVYKEAQFYMIAVSTLVITFALAVIYFRVGDGLRGEVTRPLATIPLLLYGLYLFIQWQDTAEYVSEAGSNEGVSPRKQWVLLTAGLLVILVAVEQMVQAVTTIGDAVGTPEFLWGITVVAAATSLPDTLVSLRAARDDRGVASLANVLGSNTFDLLVAIPLGVMIAGTATIDFAIAVPMMGFLTLATVFLFTVLRTDLELNDAEAYGLLGTYLVFVAWMIGETLGLISGILPGT